MKLEWSRRALRDIEEIGVAAWLWVSRLKAQARKAAAVPGIGRRVPEYERDDLREVLVRSYRIIYQRLRGGIVVLTDYGSFNLNVVCTHGHHCAKVAAAVAPKPINPATTQRHLRGRGGGFSNTRMIVISV